MSELPPRIVVSNSNRLHAHHMACGLARANMLDRFITSLWYKPNRFPYRFLPALPTSLRRSAHSFLERRSMEELDENLVEQQWFIELQRLFASAATRGRYNERMLFWHREKHDAAVSRRVKRLKPDIFIGYEISCRDSMAEAKRQQAITILDLAGFHHRFSHAVREQFEPERIDRKLLQKLADRKEAELRSSDYIFCLSTLARESLLGNGIAENRIRLINLGADTSVFQPRNKSIRGKFTILFVGAIARHKGVHLLLEAFQRANLTDAELVLIGPRCDEDLLQQYSGQYTHHPYLPHQDLARHYQAADLFVLPSFLDSWGMVVNEAMACGTAVVVSEHVGSKDIVTDRNGFVVPVGDVGALTERLQYCHDHRQEMADKGRAASESVTKLTWDRYYASTAGAIDEIWKSRRIQAV